MLNKLISKAEKDDRALVSEMVCLNTESRWEKLLIPAFVFFFQKLYPFPAVNDPKNPIAGAAGGSVLVKTEPFKKAGGFAAIRNELIDDCAAAELVKQSGHAIWLGLGTDSFSIRPYPGLKDVWRMVARTAYHQLGYSPWMLSGAVLGMTFTYLVPPVMVLTYPLHHNYLTAFAGIAAWLLMAGVYAPTLAFYRRNLLAGLLLPFTALLYTAMTVSSAVNHWRGKGGQWKERIHQAGR